MEVINKERPGKECIICKKGTVDELRFGKLYSRKDVTCHLNCLMFVSQLPQDGEDDEGIMGFLLKDIRKEIHRVVRDRRTRNFYRCKYCRKEGATVGCCVRKCKAIFHFPCGLDHDANYRFSDFTAYCKLHSLAPEVQKPAQDEECPMCTAELRGSRSKLVIGTCCKRKYHKDCVQKYALHAGIHAFKCPCCNSLGFIADMQNQGIFIPDRDASWELEEGAYADQLMDGHCETLPCVCEHGKYFQDDELNSDWQLVRCSHCGATCTHLECGQVEDPASWTCRTCTTLIQSRHP